MTIVVFVNAVVGVDDPAAAASNVAGGGGCIDTEGVGARTSVTTCTLVLAVGAAAVATPDGAQMFALALDAGRGALKLKLALVLSDAYLW